MDKFDSMHRLHRLFESHRYPIHTSVMCEQLECSIATLKRHLAFLKDVLGAPIVNKRGVGYFYDPNISFELPGLWLNAQELHALLSLQKMLHQTGQGVLREVMAPLQRRFEQLLESCGRGYASEMGRIRILAMLPRSREMPHFSAVATAVLERRQLLFHFYSRERDGIVERTVSPQRLTHYRDNWYLDGWCHLRNGLRTFSLECISDVQILDDDAVNVDEAELNRKLGSGYGIFAGIADKQAVLRFMPQRARWVADEQWHPDQHGIWLDNGSYQLTIPYAQDRELVMDICRHGPEVEVMAPSSLRDAVATQLRQAADQYL